jgi:hypothetical protein
VCRRFDPDSTFFERKEEPPHKSEMRLLLARSRVKNKFAKIHDFKSLVKNL